MGRTKRLVEDENLEVFQLQNMVNELQARNEMLVTQNLNLKDKLFQIGLKLGQAFDKDGIDDLPTPVKLSLSYLIFNAKAITKLFNDIKNIING